ncbi:prepilin-type N-terminal cleavage/methylation domain-containing protein [Proteinivorax hydrogeniformans]|uniref:Prepilin-type N-terminal cleavage/methylation domain-containing protein n=1 Tax=Proteinivorax hydrogeniformans TaxID=1826727 RepID=A0AAU8HRG6_9FIRM
MKSLKFNEKGFTLLEVLIVISLLGVILVLTVPNIATGSSHANDELCKSTIKVIEGALTQYEIVNNTELNESKLGEENIVEYLHKQNFLQNMLKCPSGGEYSLEGGKIVCSEHNDN